MQLKIKIFSIFILCIILIYWLPIYKRITYRTRIFIFNYKELFRYYHAFKSSTHNEPYSISIPNRTNRPGNLKKSIFDYAATLGTIFPRFNESKYRVNEQLEFILKHADELNALPTKVLLRVGDFNFKDLRWSKDADGCPIKNCKFISDLSKFNEVDALVISELDEYLLRKILPKPKNQIWIAQHLESPKNNRIETALLKNLINWTASYRPDSTIAIPYGYTVPEKKDFMPPLPFNRTKKVAWLVSNCYATNFRDEYVDELSKYIEVDTFGKCGDLKCDEKLGCLRHIQNQYKFYLAFENSNCANYISEKFHYSCLKHDLLPIVMGASRKEYEMLMPSPMSFIHVQDFQFPYQLASYLHQLDTNDTLYNKYFEWKTEYRIDELMQSKYYCRMCALLHLKDTVSYVHWYEDYSRWWDVCY